MKRQDDPEDQQFIELIGQAVNDLPDVPEWASQRALAAWKVPAPAKPNLLDRVGQALARLTYDSFAPSGSQIVPAFRSSSWTRQILFSHEDLDIDLRVRQEITGLFEISGQVLGPFEQGRALWTLLDMDQKVHSATIDEAGEFSFSNLSPGVGVLTLDINFRQFDLPEIVLIVDHGAI
jgi:hypothetical protein